MVSHYTGLHQGAVLRVNTRFSAKGQHKVQCKGSTQGSVQRVNTRFSAKGQHKVQCKGPTQSDTLNLVSLLVSPPVVLQQATGTRRLTRSKLSLFTATTQRICTTQGLVQRDYTKVLYN